MDDAFGGSWVGNDFTGIETYSADETGTTKDPKLVIEHSAAAAEPVIERQTEFWF